MSLDLIQESAKEVRRLAIAGSSLAVGDFRLKKLIPPLEQAGAKVPVFGQVARAIDALVNSTEMDSAAHLLAVSTLLNAILYTQGRSGHDGNFRELETHEVNSHGTHMSARQLKPLIHALTSTGSGRMEIVKSAIERGVVNDLRLIDPAIQALGDPFPELAERVAEQILPSFGPGIVPRLKSGLDLKGKKQDARRLHLMHQLDPEGTLELCKTALEEGSPEVKTAALACLSKHDGCLPLVMEQTTSKNKAVRAAALEALADHDRPETSKLFGDLIKGEFLDLLVAPFRKLRNRQVLRALLDEGRRVFELMIAGDSEQIPRYCQLLDCLEQRQETEVEGFLIDCFNRADNLAKLKPGKGATVAGTDVTARLAELLYHTGSPKSYEAILSRADGLPTAAFKHVLGSALRIWPADAVYTKFSPLLAQKKGRDKEKCEALQRHIFAACWDTLAAFDPFPYDESKSPSGDHQNAGKIAWDERWLDAAILADQQSIVCCLARPNHKAAIDYLLKVGETKKVSDLGLTVWALVRCQYSKVTEFFLALVTKKIKGAKYVDHELHSLLEDAKHLPSADLPKLDAYAATLDEKFMDAFLDAIAPLRTALKPS